MPQQSPQSNCPGLRQQYRELQELKAEFDRELERAAITKNTGAALALKNQLEQKQTEIMNTLLETDDEHALDCLLKQHQSGRELTLANLRFLYKGIILMKKNPYKQEINRNILDDIRNQRNIKQDLSRITGFPEEQISTTEEEALSGNIMLHCGDLDLSDLTSADGLKLPVSIGGDLNLFRLTSADGLEWPASIGGSLWLNSLTSVVDLELPASIGGSLWLKYLESGKGIKLPASIGGDLWLHKLTSADGVIKWPASIGGSLNLSSLTSAAGLELPASIGGSLYLQHLTSAKGIKLSQSIGGDLDLSRLTSAEGLELPARIDGIVEFKLLPDAEIDGLRKKYPNLTIVKL